MSKKTRNSPRQTRVPSQAIPMMSQQNYPVTENKEQTKNFIKARDIKFIDRSDMAQAPVVSFDQVAFGGKQDYPLAPLQVPPGFATEVPFNQAINSTIITNTSTIPMDDFWKMCCADPVVYASILSRITTIVGKIGSYVHKKKKYQDHVRKCLERVGEMKLKQALATSIWSGISACKILWVNDPKLMKTMPAAILHLPPDSLLLAVTPEGQIDEEMGLLHYYYNNASGSQQNPKAFVGGTNAPFASFVTYMTPQREVVFNPMFLSAIPADWRIIHTFNPIGIAGNHWGTSSVLPIYASLMGKFNMLKKIQIAASYKASPLVCFFTNTETQVQLDDGTFIPMSDHLNNILPQASKTGMLVIAGMNSVDIKTIDNTADLEKMFKIVEGLNHEIRTGLLTADTTGNSSSFANAKVGVDSQKDIDMNFVQQFVHTMIHQFSKPCLEFGFPEEEIDQIEGWGHFEIIDNSLNDQVMAAKVLEVAKSIGVINPKSLEDYNIMRKKMGFPPVSKLEDDAVAAMLSGMADMSSMGVDMADAKSTIKQPYANGLDDHEAKYK